MHAPGPQRLTLTNPDEVITAIPYLLGFYPTSSLVVLGFTGPAAGRLGCSLRADLPPEHDPATEHLIERIARLLVGNNTRTAVAVVVGTAQPDHALPPHRLLIETLSSKLGDGGITLGHAFWIETIGAGQPWRCYDATNACAGKLSHPGASVLAAHLVTAGRVTHASRDALADHLAPTDPGALTRRAQRLADLPNEINPVSAFQAVSAAVQAAQRGHLPDTDGQILTLAHALTDPQVRDACLLFCLGNQTSGAERLWLALVQQTPPPHRSHAAALYAITQWLSGDGALAAVAVDNAIDAQPENRLAQLLARTLDGGMPQAELRDIVVGAGLLATVQLIDASQG